MKKISIIAIMALFATNIANAQDPEELRDSWQKTITVRATQDPIVERFFTAWGEEFPGKIVDLFYEYKYSNGRIDKQDKDSVNVDYAPKNGFIEIYSSKSTVVKEDGNFVKGEVITRENILQAVYWNLPSGNKLFGVSIKVDEEIFSNCAVMFYEYDATKGNLTPRADIVKSVMEKMGISYPPEGEDAEIFVKLPKQGRDLKYFDYAAGADKVIKWNGNGF